MTPFLFQANRPDSLEFFVHFPSFSGTQIKKQHQNMELTNKQPQEQDY
jgi:hypothetical protein